MQITENITFDCEKYENTNIFPKKAEICLEYSQYQKILKNIKKLQVESIKNDDLELAFRIENEIKTVRKNIFALRIMIFIPNYIFVIIAHIKASKKISSKT